MYTVLLVEDEVLIADMISRMILKSPTIETVLHARNVPEAIKHMKGSNVDLALLDINLSSEQSGLDLADRLKDDSTIPIIYLTSNQDRATLERVKSTKPIAYLNKPVIEATLLTTIELALEEAETKKGDTITLQIGKHKMIFEESELLIVRADHVYTELHFKNRKEVERITLKQLIESAPTGLLQRINRSEAVNPKHITKVSTNKVWLSDGSVLRVSPSYKEALQ